MNPKLDRLTRGLFGDRLGIVVFLAALSTYLCYWRIGILITDTYTVANTLVAVSEWQFHVEQAVYGSSLETPGMGARDGRLYGRNYGQVLLSLPILWALEAVAAVADLRVALAALWALSLLALAVLVGRELERPELAAYLGSALALLAFVAAVWGATPIDADRRYLLALQLQTMGAAAFVGVVCYRLVARGYGRRIGLVAGLAVGLATPVGFWAQFPKRHTLATLCVVTTMYFLYRSREGDGIDTRFRAAAYLPVGVAVWVSAIEGAILLAALLVVDVSTGGRDLRSLFTAGVTCVVAVLPMFVTNLFVTGNPARPPRTLTYNEGEALASGGSETASGGAVIPDILVSASHLLGERLGRGVAVLTDPTRLYHVFVRGGYLPNVAKWDAGEAIRLSFLEAMPLAAALVAVPVVAFRADVRAGVSTLLERRRLTPLGTVDAFAVVYGLVLTLVYLPRMPVHATITVRYLLVLFPIAVYGLVRMAGVRRVLDDEGRTCGFTYAAGVLVGGQTLAIYLWFIDATRGEAMQAHAFIGLAVAAVLAGWALTDAAGYRNDRLGAVALGLAAAAGTVFLLLAALWHFAFVGPQAVPLG